MIKTALAQSARTILKRLGVDTYSRPNNTLAAITPLHHPCDALYQTGDIAFEVPLEKCRYPYHFSYDPKGWHPFVATLRQYQNNPELRYEDSILHEYYERYQPKNILEAFFPNPNAEERTVGSSLEAFAVPPYAPFFPWNPQKLGTQAERGLDASHGNQGYGPVSEEKGRLEFRRLTETYDSIARTGYKPFGGHDGDIRGYFLRSDNDYRFFVRQGLHRTAVLTAMDYKSVRVRFFDPSPRAIFLSDARNWPQVKADILSETAARKLFMKFFEENGTEKAQRLGLLHP